MTTWVWFVGGQKVAEGLLDECAASVLAGLLPQVGVVPALGPIDEVLQAPARAMVSTYPRQHKAHTILPILALV